MWSMPLLTWLWSACIDSSVVSLPVLPSGKVIFTQRPSSPEIWTPFLFLIPVYPETFFVFPLGVRDCALARPGITSKFPLSSLRVILRLCFLPGVVSHVFFKDCYRLLSLSGENGGLVYENCLCRGTNPIVKSLLLYDDESRWSIGDSEPL